MTGSLLIVAWTNANTVRSSFRTASCVSLLPSNSDLKLTLAPEPTPRPQFTRPGRPSHCLPSPTEHTSTARISATPSSAPPASPTIASRSHPQQRRSSSAGQGARRRLQIRRLRTGPAFRFTTSGRECTR